MNDVTVPAPAASHGEAAGGEERGSARRCALAQIAAARESGKPVSDLVRASAAALGVAPRTIWRWLEDGVPGPRPPAGWEPSQDDVDAYVRWKANAAAAWRERRAEGADVPPLRTFQAGLARSFEAGERAVMREGVEARRRHQVYLRWEPEARNELWEADHKELDVLVLFPRAQRPRRPWATILLDAFSRAVMGWAIADRPSSATVIAALGQSIRVDAERGPFCGVPATIRPDRGLEFAAGVLQQACGLLAIRLSPTPGHSPHLKGKVERLQGSVVGELLAAMPHFTGGPRDAAGKLWGSGLPMLTLGELVARFDAWVLLYNRQLPHAGLGGQTPLQRWSEDATPLRIVCDEELRWTLLGEADRLVRKAGIRFHGIDFIAPELNGLVGENVEVRYRPHDDRSIEVFRAGRHLCTALPQGALGPDERAAVLDRRREDAARQAQLARRATRRARERLAPLTGPGPVEDVSVVTTAASDGERASRDADRLRRAARTDLLGLPSARAQ